MLSFPGCCGPSHTPRATAGQLSVPFLISSSHSFLFLTATHCPCWPLLPFPYSSISYSRNLLDLHLFFLSLVGLSGVISPERGVEGGDREGGARGEGLARLLESLACPTQGRRQASESADFRLLPSTRTHKGCPGVRGGARSHTRTTAQRRAHLSLQQTHSRQARAHTVHPHTLACTHAHTHTHGHALG